MTTGRFGRSSRSPMAGTPAADLTGAFDGLLKSSAKRLIFRWRPRPELNRGARFCRALRHHSATWPHRGAFIRPTADRQPTSPSAAAAAEISFGPGFRREFRDRALDFA